MSGKDSGEAIVWSIILGVLVLNLGFWGGCIYIVLHFVTKWW